MKARVADRVPKHDLLGEAVHRVRQLCLGTMGTGGWVLQVKERVRV